MDRTRDNQKRRHKSKRKNRYPLAMRHKLGLSATTRAAAKRAAKAASKAK